MKLRNKKTGKIWDIGKVLTNDYPCYESLKQINDEWEDYKEPKRFYWLDYDGKICNAEIGTMDRSRIKQIGNYFETKEEAEKAVEKLKAWKRLKDKGISFEVKVIDRKWYLEPKAEPQQRTFDESHDIFKDIMFIFGGEE